MDRQYARLRRDRRRIRGRADHEVDVAGADLLQHLGLLPQLRAGKLVDRHRTVAHLHELGVEEVRRDAVARRMRLVIGEAEMARAVRPCETARKTNRDGKGCRAQPPSAHPAFLPLAAAPPPAGAGAAFFRQAYPSVRAMSILHLGALRLGYPRGACSRVFRQTTAAGGQDRTLGAQLDDAVR